MGVPKVVIPSLLAYATDNDRFGSPIYADELSRYLVESNIHPKRLEHDSRIAPAVEVLQREFTESIRPRLIGGKPLSEAKQRC